MNFLKFHTILYQIRYTVMYFLHKTSCITHHAFCHRHTNHLDDKTQNAVSLPKPQLPNDNDDNDNDNDSEKAICHEQECHKSCENDCNDTDRRFMP